MLCFEFVSAGKQNNGNNAQVETNDHKTLHQNTQTSFKADEGDDPRHSAAYERPRGTASKKRDICSIKRKSDIHGTQKEARVGPD
ncbi:hypothetical protein PoB_007011800 [Plakobranchus ocellatus]|uniref:Uncharacterized protein n=1 Tax=Plakobranchus ocellatus TaxID=259542 RepID=A0AAV4DHU3_9GAST|nr:hypothetical protein PoB_007011800 [Plakobranchus ocellatus]